jgi:hypothetical protein
MFKARALCQQTGPVVDAYGHIVDASKLRKEQSNPGERSSKRGGGFSRAPVGTTALAAFVPIVSKSVSHLMYIFAVHKIRAHVRIVCSRAHVEQSHMHSAGSAFIAWSAVTSAARLSGHTGLKLSIRRLAFYTRQPARSLPYRRYFADCTNTTNVWMKPS